MAWKPQGQRFARRRAWRRKSGRVPYVAERTAPKDQRFSDLSSPPPPHPHRTPNFPGLADAPRGPAWEHRVPPPTVLHIAKWRRTALMLLWGQLWLRSNYFLKYFFLIKMKYNFGWLVRMNHLGRNADQHSAAGTPGRRASQPHGSQHWLLRALHSQLRRTPIPTSPWPRETRHYECLYFIHAETMLLDSNRMPSW